MQNGYARRSRSRLGVAGRVTATHSVSRKVLIRRAYGSLHSATNPCSTSSTAKEQSAIDKLELPVVYLN